MSYVDPGAGTLDYFPCRYGASKLQVRGPRRDLQGDYIAFLGGSETYGRFVADPFPSMVEQMTGRKTVNLGCINAGLDAYTGDEALLGICRGARATVIQVMGAQNMSNPCYQVHSRRNDRFLQASEMLTNLYPEVDFTEFNFTRHMLQTLERQGPQRFETVRMELKDAWVARMTGLMRDIGGPVVLLWLADHEPPKDDRLGALAPDPLFVDCEMLRQVARGAARGVQIVGTAQDIVAGFSQLVYGPMERPAAEALLGPVVHRRTAVALARVLPAVA